MARRVIWLGGMVCVLFGNAADGRGLESWSYDRLMKEADLVVVAVAKSSEDTADEPTNAQARKNKWFIGRTSTVTVQGTLKGKSAEEIKILHFRLNKDRVQAIVDGPNLIEFRTGTTKIKVKGYETPIYSRVEYLLFLKARKDGRYEPLSGEYDPDQSVREMYSPLGPEDRK